MPVVPDCADCGGACCEYLEVPVFDNEDATRWLALHGEEDRTNRTILLDCKCSALTAAGQCGIYDTRPEVCRDFAVGSKPCLEAIKRQRPEYWMELDGDVL